MIRPANQAIAIALPGTSDADLYRSVQEGNDELIQGTLSSTEASSARPGLVTIGEPVAGSRISK